MRQAIYLLLILLLSGIKMSLFAQRYVDTVNVVRAYEVHVYEIEGTEKYTKILMAYASATLQNPEAWTAIADKNFPIEVDLVYTKYPVNYDAWRCNYDKILNQRIKNLIELDPIFRAVDVKWNLVIQTNCKTELEAKAMFHGIVIKYQPRDLVVVANKIDSKTGKVVEENKTVPISEEKKTTPAPVPVVPKEFSSEAAMNPATPARMIYGEDVSTIDDVKDILRGELKLKDSTIMSVLLRHPEWKNSLIVMDWTASMYQYGAQLLMWHRLNLEKNISQVSHFVFFNDGDGKRSGEKMSGNTGGIYKAKTNSLQEVIRTMATTMNAGTGGDIQENDLEALVKGLKIEDFDDVILIADNTAVRDMFLLPQIKKPIHVIICDPKDDYVNPEYIKIAFETGGTLHTLKEDIMQLSQLSEDSPLTRSSGKFTLEGGRLVRIDKK